jgi:fructokinase
MSKAPLVAGVELGGTKCICILATGPDDIRDEVRIPTTTPDETLGAIAATLEKWRGFDAIGIASFGPVSLDHEASDFGHITATTKPGWSNTDVLGKIGTPFKVPVGFNSDVNGAAMGEGRWGAAAGLADHAYITVGTGIGVGLVLGGKPVAGLTHPELGHIRPVRTPGDDWKGSCSFHGACLEGLASGTAIKARTGTAAQDLAHDDPAWDLVADALAQLLHTLVMTGIPRRIVMGGGVMVGSPFLFDPIRERLVTSIASYGSLPGIHDMVDYVVPAKLGGNAGPLGAIVLGETALGG